MNVGVFWGYLAYFEVNFAVMCIHDQTDLSELVEGELFAGLHQLLDDLSDTESRQWQVRRLEEFMELILADEPVVVNVCGRRKRLKALGLNPSVHSLTCRQDNIYLLLFSNIRI